MIWASNPIPCPTWRTVAQRYKAKAKQRLLKDEAFCQKLDGSFVVKRQDKDEDKNRVVDDWQWY